jgi:hypothetical protein
MLVIGSTASYNSIFPAVNRINTNDHCVFESGKRQMVEVLSQLGIDLLQQVRPSSHLPFLENSVAENELGRNADLVTDSLDLLFVTFVVNDDQDELSVFWIDLCLHPFDEAIWTSWLVDFYPLWLFNLDSKDRRSISESLHQLVSIVEISRSVDHSPFLILEGDGLDVGDSLPCVIIPRSSAGTPRIQDLWMVELFGFDTCEVGVQSQGPFVKDLIIVEFFKNLADPIVPL